MQINNILYNRVFRLLFMHFITLIVLYKGLKKLFILCYTEIDRIKIIVYLSRLFEILYICIIFTL